MGPIGSERNNFRDVISRSSGQADLKARLIWISNENGTRLNRKSDEDLIGGISEIRNEQGMIRMKLEDASLGGTRTLQGGREKVLKKKLLA